MQEKTDRMKKRLENLGEVNPTAIEAFTEMKKRYEFILEQKNDLVTAKESLIANDPGSRSNGQSEISGNIQFSKRKFPESISNPYLLKMINAILY